MFVLKKSHTYFWPVKLELPKDGGSFEKVSFDAEFKQLSQTRIKEVFNNVSDDAHSVKDSDFCKEVIVGWKGVKSESGDDIPFTDSALSDMLEIPSLSRCIVQSYLESIAGSKIKN